MKVIDKSGIIMSKRKRKKKKTKLSPMRSWEHLVAWFRSTAGPMEENKKHTKKRHSKKKSRQWKQRKKNFDE